MDIDENPADQEQPPNEGVSAVNPPAKKRKNPKKRSPKKKKKSNVRKKDINKIGKKTVWYNDPNVPQWVKDDFNALTTYAAKHKRQSLIHTRYRKTGGDLSNWKPRYRSAVPSISNRAWYEDGRTPQENKDEYDRLQGRAKKKYAGKMVSRYRKFGTVVLPKRGPPKRIRKRKSRTASSTASRQSSVVKEEPGLLSVEITGHGASRDQALNLELTDSLGITEPDLGDEEVPRLEPEEVVDAIELRAGRHEQTLMTFTPDSQLGVRESPADRRDVTNPANVVSGSRKRKPVNYAEDDTVITPRSMTPTGPIRDISVHSADPTLEEKEANEPEIESEDDDAKLSEPPATVRFVDEEVASLLGSLDDSSTLAGLSTGSRWEPQATERRQREEDDINRIQNAPIQTMPTRWTNPQNVGHGQELVTDSLPVGMSVGIRNVRPDARYRTDAPPARVFGQNIPVVGGVINKDVANFYYQKSFEPAFKRSWASESMPWLFGASGIYPMLYSECDCEDDIDGTCLC